MPASPLLHPGFDFLYITRLRNLDLSTLYETLLKGYFDD